MADIFQIVEYEGDNSTFVFKSRAQNFNTGTQLIVHESQEAVFFMNGQALDLFGPGRHTLETQNIPLVRKFLNKPTNDQTPFRCEVYFINKTEQMAIKWGTDSQVQFLASDPTEPTEKIPLKIGASGEMSLKVEDSRKLLVNIVGTEKSLSQAALTQKFRAFLMARIKPYLANTMQTSDFSIFEVDSHMGELSESLYKQLTPDFSEYGLSLKTFFVTTLVKPDGDPTYEKLKTLFNDQYFEVKKAKLRQEVGVIDQQTEAQKMVIESQGLAQKRKQEDYTYQQEQGFIVAKAVAQNEGIGNFTSTGVGLGMMGGVAGGMGAHVAGITTMALDPIMQGQTPQPEMFGGIVTPPPSVDLAPETPASTYTVPSPAPAPSPAPVDEMAVFKLRIEKLKVAKESGLLSDEEFEARRQDLLNSL